LILCSEAQVAEKDDMIRLLDQQCALYERMLPQHSLDHARAAQPAPKAKKLLGKASRLAVKSD
jgi:hypothetical protein